MVGSNGHSNGAAGKYETRLFINGEYVDSTSKNTLTIHNPTDETLVTDSVQSAGPEDVEKAVVAAENAFKGEWGSWTAKQRSKALHKLADLIEQRTEELAPLETVAMGAPLLFGRMFLAMAADVFRYYAGWTDKIPGEQWPAEDGTYRLVSYEPFGVCAGIGAWNVSFILFANKVAPALAAGNTFIWKSSEKSPLGCLALGSLFNDAGFPPGVLNILNGAGDIGAALASHMRIRKISFTGSLPTGKKIQQMAGASNLKRVTLELGGKSPALVFDDADLDNALDVCSQAFLMNTTQACIATSRTFVHESIKDAFIEGLKTRFDAARNSMGDPMLASTMFGPLADRKQYERVMSYIEAGKREATLATGGARIGDKGHFVQPTIFLDPPDNASIYRDEIFGPVLSVRTFKTEEEAVRLANDTNYGLSSTVFTKSMARALRVSRQIEAGTVAINQPHAPGVSTPFGGFKESGVGREMGKAGIMGYLQDKTIFINMKVE